MIITADQARQLLADAPPGPWGQQNYGPEEPVDITAPIGPLGLPAPIAHAYTTHIATLIAAAPGLALTVMAQATEIERLKNQVRCLQHDTPDERTLDVPADFNTNR